MSQAFLGVGVVLFARLRIRVVMGMRMEDFVVRYILGTRGRFEKERGVLGRFWSGGLLGNGAGERGSGTFGKKGGDWGRRQGSAVDVLNPSRPIENRRCRNQQRVSSVRDYFLFPCSWRGSTGTRSQLYKQRTTLRCSCTPPSKKYTHHEKIHQNVHDKFNRNYTTWIAVVNRGCNTLY